MTKIYLSPSTQTPISTRVGTGIRTAKRHGCENSSSPQAILLTASPRPDVRVGGNISVGANVTDSKNWGANWHSRIHTNAGGGMEGVLVLHWLASGLKMAKRHLSSHALAASNMPDRGIKTSTGYYALRRTKAPLDVGTSLPRQHDGGSGDACLGRRVRSGDCQGIRQVVWLGRSRFPNRLPTTPPPVPTVPPTAVWKVASQTATTINLVKS